MTLSRVALLGSIILSLAACIQLTRTEYNAALEWAQRYKGYGNYAAARGQLDVALRDADRLDEPERTEKLNRAFRELSASDETEARRRYGMELAATPTSPPATPTRPPPEQPTATPLPKEVVRAARTPPPTPRDREFLSKREMIEDVCLAEIEYDESTFEAERIAREQGGNWFGEPEAMRERAERRLSLATQQYRRRYGSLPPSLLSRGGNYICSSTCAAVAKDLWLAPPCNESACQGRLPAEHCSVLEGLRCTSANVWAPACVVAKALRQHAMCGDVIGFIATEKCWELLQEDAAPKQ